MRKRSRARQQGSDTHRNDNSHWLACHLGLIYRATSNIASPAHFIHCKMLRAAMMVFLASPKKASCSSISAPLSIDNNQCWRANVSGHPVPHQKEPVPLPSECLLRKHSRSAAEVAGTPHSSIGSACRLSQVITRLQRMLYIDA
jgi:hypothetical protein